MTSFSSLCSERLLLPALTAEHTADVAALYSDPDVARYVGGGRLTPSIIEQQVAAFEQEWSERGYGQSAVLERATGEFLGRIGLHYWPNWDEVELGYVLRTSAQGRGFAVEGCRAWLDAVARQGEITSLIANIHPDNFASAGLAEKLGFHLDRHDETPSGLPTLIYRRAMA